MSDEEIRDDLGGPHRKGVLDSVFARFPQQFRADKAGDRSARIDFRVTGGPATAATATPSSSRTAPAASRRARRRRPTCRSMLGPAEFLKLITGTGNPAMMFMMGKVKAKGDLGLAAGLANWFESPKA